MAPECVACPLTSGWPDANWWKDHGKYIANREKWSLSIQQACERAQTSGDQGYSSVCRWAEGRGYYAVPEE